MTTQVALSTNTYGKLYVLVDDTDAADVLQYKWHVLYTSGKYYAYRSTPGRQDRTSVLLHRQLMNAPDGVKVDHINGDGLDCQRSNMRLATDEQNRWNARRKRSKSGYIGVREYTVKHGTRYQAKMNGTHISTHDTAHEAALAYDRYARNLYGDFAVLNFPTQCNGLCRPDLCLYEAKCPLHGAAALVMALNERERDNA